MVFFNFGLGGAIAPNDGTEINKWSTPFSPVILLFFYIFFSPPSTWEMCNCPPKRLFSLTRSKKRGGKSWSAVIDTDRRRNDEISGDKGRFWRSSSPACPAGLTASPDAALCSGLMDAPTRPTTTTTTAIALRASPLASGRGSWECEKRIPRAHFTLHKDLETAWELLRKHSLSSRLLRSRLWYGATTHQPGNWAVIFSPPSQSDGRTERCPQLDSWWRCLQQKFSMCEFNLCKCKNVCSTKLFHWLKVVSFIFYSHSGCSLCHERLARRLGKKSLLTFDLFAFHSPLVAFESGKLNPENVMGLNQRKHTHTHQMCVRSGCSKDDSHFENHHKIIMLLYMWFIFSVAQNVDEFKEKFFFFFF